MENRENKINKLLQDIDLMLNKHGVESFNGEFAFKKSDVKITYNKKLGGVGNVIKTEPFLFDSTDSNQREI